MKEKGGENGIMRTRALAIIVTVGFLLLLFPDTTTVSAYDGKVIDRLVVTEHIVFGWEEIFPGYEVKVDGFSHMVMIMLETNDPSVIRVVERSVWHAETGLRLTDPVTGMVKETKTVIKTSQTSNVGTISLLDLEDMIEFCRIIGSILIIIDGKEVPLVHLNALSIIKFVDGEILWTKTWIFIDHEKAPVP